MRRAARRIVERLRFHGHEAFFAGGWVRDFLLRRNAKDIDIATSAKPEEVLHLFQKSTPIGAEFGVVQVRMYGRPFEVATFRREETYVDGRHPSKVVFAGPEQDALRRDFTVNGLFYDPIADRLIDYVHGSADIKNRVLRTIGKPDDRFSEDKLRMMRAIRLACSLEFAIEQETWEAIRRFSSNILQVSWERIRDELLKIITGPMRARGLDLLLTSGLLSRILPEVGAMCGVPQPQNYHPEGDVFAHSRVALAMLRKPSAVLALGTLLHDIGKPLTLSIRDRIRFDGHVEIGAQLAGRICERLRISNEEKQQVVDLVANHLRFMDVKEMRESTLKRFLRKPNFPEHLELHRVDCLSSNRDLSNYWFCREMLQQMRSEQPPPPPLVTGRDLIELGHKPGPIFKQILQDVEESQLEGVLQTRREALEHIKKNYPLPAKSQS